MTAPSGIFLPVGTRSLRFYALNAAGLPNATSTTVYEGIVAQAVKVMTPNWVSHRVIDFAGDDILQQRDILPPITGGQVTITVSAEDYVTHALLSGTKVDTVGEAKRIGVMTSNMGFEPDVGVFIWQQGIEAVLKTDGTVNTQSGSRRWRAIVFPKAVFVPKPQGMGENVLDTTYEGTPRVVTQDLWGGSFTTSTNGYIFAQATDYEFTFKPLVVAWLGDNLATKFSFAATHQCADIAKAKVAINGVVDATAVIAVDGVTPTAKPGVTDLVTCLYEWA